ncbi:MAG: flagellar basal body rod protein FlgB [Limnobacter sp.]|nr:flagellar basal body rod protein FlgB [Limnobacter sp.]
MLDKLSDSMQFSAAALELRAKRQEVLTSNITNVDTPNYKAVDFQFSEALKQATGTGKDEALLARRGATLSTTHEGHIGPLQSGGLSTQALLKYRHGGKAALDNNSVDIEKERAAFAENTVKYEAALRAINGRIAALKSAMGTGNQ